ncbi:hypothetical protein CDAR_306491 [Caerostris darwini]|uniref:Uncharacterized protein n=1 Tax=Caerostris darwini TaxID=1538125 RepID=A0AAV4SRJ1_9ARAC|nr:hypothetical protein CDAR_306491 [Caerostris darwini]
MEGSAYKREGTSGISFASKLKNQVPAQAQFVTILPPPKSQKGGGMGGFPVTSEEFEERPSNAHTLSMLKAICVKPMLIES